MLSMLTGVPRPVWIGAAVLALLGSVFVLGRCSAGDGSDAGEQARQTTRSGEAIAGAAQDAISTLEGREATEKEIDRAVADATKEIDNAKDAAAVRDAVLDALCVQDSHRDDPACVMRAAHP